MEFTAPFSISTCLERLNDQKFTSNAFVFFWRGIEVNVLEIEDNLCRFQFRPLIPMRGAFHITLAGIDGTLMQVGSRATSVNLVRQMNLLIVLPISIIAGVGIASYFLDSYNYGVDGYRFQEILITVVAYLLGIMLEFVIFMVPIGIIWGKSIEMIKDALEE